MRTPSKNSTAMSTPASIKANSRENKKKSIKANSRENKKKKSIKANSRENAIEVFIPST